MKKNKKGVVVNISSTYGNVSPNPKIYGNSGINSISYLLMIHNMKNAY